MPALLKGPGETQPTLVENRSEVASAILVEVLNS
jgi:hypothetical protein